MATTYHVVTSDNVMHDVRAHSAVEAITKGLERNRGLTVIECFSGNILMTDPNAGRITYDVPRHAPIPPDPDEP